MNLKECITKINRVINRIDFEKYFEWFIQKFSLIDKSKELNDKKK